VDSKLTTNGQILFLVDNNWSEVNKNSSLLPRKRLNQHLELTASPDASFVGQLNPWEEL
jgi:hypothetical protein